MLFMSVAVQSPVSTGGVAAPQYRPFAAVQRVPP
jgi:hypothetical protein